MKHFDPDKLLDNEREWRRYLIDRVEEISRELHRVKAEALVARIIGGSAFALALAWFEWKLNQ